jgi:hypothetical protein
MATKIDEFSAADAQAATNEARAAFADVEARADAGDLALQPGDVAVARETLDLAERRLRAVERREHERAEAARVERRDAARRDLLAIHANGRAEVAAKVEAARAALDDLLTSCRSHDASTVAAVRRLRDLTSTDTEAAMDVIYNAASDEFVAHVSGEKVYVTHPPFILAELAVEALDRAGLRDRTLARQGLEVIASAWPRGALYPWTDR